MGFVYLKAPATPTKVVVGENALFAKKLTKEEKKAAQAAKKAAREAKKKAAEEAEN